MGNNMKPWLRVPCQPCDAGLWSRRLTAASLNVCAHPLSKWTCAGFVRTCNAGTCLGVTSTCKSLQSLQYLRSRCAGGLLAFSGGTSDCSPPSLQTTSDPERFVLHPQPLEYKYSEFERLLLGIAHHIYITKKKGEAFEEVGGRLIRC